MKVNPSKKQKSDCGRQTSKTNDGAMSNLRRRFFLKAFSVSEKCILSKVTTANYPLTVSGNVSLTTLGTAFILML